ncbi:hypothetical protein MBANPS3_011019 [Mucor bainieri]
MGILPPGRYLQVAMPLSTASKCSDKQHRIIEKSSSRGSSKDTKCEQISTFEHYPTATWQLLLQALFPKLTKLHVEEISCQSITFYSLLDTAPLLQELSVHYPMSRSHFLGDFPLKVFPSMRKLDLKFELCDDFHHLHVVHLLSFFTNLESLTLSLTDGVNRPVRADQLYSIEEIVSLVSKLGNSSVHVYFRTKSFHLSMPPYLQCILDANEQVKITAQREDFHMVFTESCFLGNYIRYSTSQYPLSKFMPIHYITLPSRMSTNLVRNIMHQSSLRLTTTIEFICRNTSNTFEINSAQLLNTVLEECSQAKRLILRGSSNFECYNPIHSSSILELRLHEPQLHLPTILQDTLFSFPSLQRIFIQTSLHKHWKSDICIYMPNNTFTEICIAVGDPSRCCSTKKALIRALFIVDLEIRQSGKKQHRCFRYHNGAMRQMYNESFEAIKSKSEIYRLRLVFQHLDVLVFKYGEHSSKLWDASLNLQTNE